MTILIPILYILAASLFIIAIKGLSNPRTSRTGNFLGMLGMGCAVAGTLLTPGSFNLKVIILCIVAGGIVGVLLALKVQLTSMPQLIAIF